MAAAAVSGFDWPAFRALTDGYPWKIDYLAAKAGVDGDWLEQWLRDEIARRRAALPEEALSIRDAATASAKYCVVREKRC